VSARAHGAAAAARQRCGRLGGDGRGSPQVCGKSKATLIGVPWKGKNVGAVRQQRSLGVGGSAPRRRGACPRRAPASACPQVHSCGKGARRGPRTGRSPAAFARTGAVRERPALCRQHPGARACAQTRVKKRSGPAPAGRCGQAAGRGRGASARRAWLYITTPLYGWTARTPPPNRILRHAPHRAVTSSVRGAGPRPASHPPLPGVTGHGAAVRGRRPAEAAAAPLAFQLLQAFRDWLRRL
jgi:hypothetical protein